jgi:Protease inhibitor Inh
MRVVSSGLSTLALVALVLSGCQSSRITGIDTAPAASPVAAAPAGTVTSAPLPAPTAPQPVTPPVTDPAQFPAAPTAPAATAPTAPAGEQVASAAVDLKVSNVVGGWRASGATEPCQMMISQTKTGQGFRAAPRRCTGELQKLASWQLAGKMMVFYDEGGNVIARLFGTGSGLSGQTTGGQSITLNR